MKMFGRISIVFVMVLSVPLYSVMDFSSWGVYGSYQCHGDADGQMSGMFRVGMGDLVIFQNVFAAAGGFPVFYPDFGYDPRADFDRNFRVDTGDQEILEEWYGQLNVPNDCGKKLELNFYKDYVPACSTQSITWTWRVFTSYVPMPPSEDAPGSFALYYMDASVSSDWIYIGNGTGYGPIEWQVPDIDSTQCLLLLEDLDHPGLEDVSELYFTIFQCQHDPEIDVDHDCIITMVDYASFAANWQIEPDGKTIDDLATLANSWLECGNPYDPDRCSY